jgi:hypothetical protein
MPIRHDRLRQPYGPVFLDVDSMPATGSFVDAIGQAIDEAVSNGFVLALLSPDALASEFVKREILHALEKARSVDKSNVVPVILRDRDAVFSQLPLHLATIQCFDLTEPDFGTRLADLVEELKTRQMQ